MNIDLLITNTGEAGLIASDNFIKKITGAVLDTATGVMVLEYVDSDYLDLNIPVEADFFETLESNQQIHVGAIKNANISQAYQIPLMFLDDPYRGQQLGKARQSAQPLLAFGAFLKRCVNGQPVHRSDLGDESAMGCILGDASPASLQFAPHLARRAALEAGPRTPAPRGPGPSGPGLGSGGGGNSYPPRDGRDDKNR